ncbi:hypothetical protein LguiB_032876 [Lonicera macranthoides]
MSDIERKSDSKEIEKWQYRECKMASPKKIEACGEHKLPIKDDEKEKKHARLQRAQWLRAAILGANDGLLSTTSLMLGVGAAKEDQRSMVLSGLAGALAGACSMAVGEFVSVSTQRDIERAVSAKCDLKAHEGDDIKVEITSGPNPTVVEKNTLSEANSTVPPKLTLPLERVMGMEPCEANSAILPKLSPLGRIKGTEPYEANSAISPTLECLGRVKGTEPYEANSASSPKLTPMGRIRGGEPFECRHSRERPSPGRNSPGYLSPMMKVVISDTKMNRMKGAEKDDDNEEENSDDALPNPYKAAGASAAAFVCGSLVPLVPAICVAENTARIVVIVITTSIALALFGGIGAQLGGSPLRASAIRVLLGGWLSMAITYGLLKPLDRDDKGNKND